VTYGEGPGHGVKFAEYNTFCHHIHGPIVLLTYALDGYIILLSIGKTGGFEVAASC
jgi:hypothetical protein